MAAIKMQIKHKGGLFKQVVTNTGCTKLNYLHCIKVHHHDLRKGDNLRHKTIIDYKFLLITYHNIFWHISRTPGGPATKILSTIDHELMIIH